MNSILLLLLLFHPQQVHNEFEGEITVDGVQRTYRVFIPELKSPDEKLPMVMVFHGGKGSGADMIRFTRFNDLAETERFITVYPNGWHGGWNDHRIGEKLPQEQDDVKFISMLIDEMVAHHNADGKRVFASGISNGAIFSLLLAQELSEKILAIAPVCGSIPVNYAATYHIDRPLSILIINGTADPLVKYEGGAVVSEKSKRGAVIATDSMIHLLTSKTPCNAPIRREEFSNINPKDGCTAEKFIYPACGKGPRVTLIKVTGGGHTWPGGNQYLPKSMVGNVCRDFSATSEIWNFFKAQPERQ